MPNYDDLWADVDFALDQLRIRLGKIHKQTEDDAAGGPVGTGAPDPVIAAAVAAERERCARIAELREHYEAGKETGFWKKGTIGNDNSATAHHMAALACSAIIDGIRNGE